MAGTGRHGFARHVLFSNGLSRLRLLEGEGFSAALFPVLLLLSFYLGANVWAGDVLSSPLFIEK